MNGEEKTVGKGCEGRVDIYLKGAGRRYREGKQIVYSSSVQQKDKKELCKLCAAHNNAVGPYVIICSHHCYMDDTVFGRYQSYQCGNFKCSLWFRDMPVCILLSSKCLGG